MELRAVTGNEAGYSGDDQIKIALRAIMEKGGKASTDEIYRALEIELNSKGFTLSVQGKASLRFFVNSVAVKAGYIRPYDKNYPGWEITSAGKQLINTQEEETETVIDVDENTEVRVLSNSARGIAFEKYILELLKKMYPKYLWYHQGVHKSNERGLDFIGDSIDLNAHVLAKIGVQVKFHAPNNAPATLEWLKFLSGCFTRRVDSAIFVTTGRLTPEQRRESGEVGRLLIMEGKDEINRIAQQHNYQTFELFDDNQAYTEDVAGQQLLF